MEITVPVIEGWGFLLAFVAAAGLIIVVKWIIGIVL